MKKFLISLMFVGLGLAASTSNAFAIDSGILIGQDFRVQFQNWDASQIYFTSNPSLPTGQSDSYGLIEVTNINRIAGGVLWSETSADALTGILYGIDDASVVVTGNASSINSTGGFIDIYSKPFTLDAAAANAPATPYTVLPTDLWGATGTASQLYLRLQFVPGIITGDLNTTFHVDQTSLTNPVSGSSSGYLKVIGGSAAGIFDSNAYDSISSGADMYFVDQFSTINLTAAQQQRGWLVGSGGNALGTGVPEPASMTLLGLGLAGLLRLRRKV